MKRWSGGLLIIALAIILVSRYSSIGIQPQKQSTAYHFFHPTDETSTEKIYSNISSRVKEKNIPKPREKPDLINVEGLNDLYASNNFSTGESQHLLVWDHMRSLVSRSDALPDTAQAVNEASIVWRDLLSSIKKDRASKFNNSDNPEDCPLFVSSFDTGISSNETVLELPCGLVEDSSITVVGIPDGRQRSFQIDLVASQLSGQPKPPIILHYNVSLPGDNMTEEPFIVQNTWTSEFGWGKEERCPAHGSANIMTVDGLVLCNEQVVRSTLEENVNANHTSNDTSAKVSGESAHASVNFPFVDGSPFTATLWVGSEGFHMTVNGRHETSFMYAEKLEPWSVSKVKVAGGLDLSSALAKGLPVPEDHDLNIDVDHLKAPLLPKKRVVLLIGVFSTGNNFDRRMALRRSWMQYEAVRSGVVAVRFFIGLHKSKQVNYKLWREARAYGDVLLMPFVDYYSLISLKTIAICILGTKILPAKYIMKTDDDAFVRIDEILKNLPEKPHNGLLYGLIASESSPDRDKDSKWYISNEEWPHPSYPPWAHGPGYIISRDIAKFIVQGHHERDLKLFKLEDVAMGIWIEQFKNIGREVHYVSDKRFYNTGCESDYLLAHYQGPRMVLCLWEKLQKNHAGCCE